MSNARILCSLLLALPCLAACGEDPAASGADGDGGGGSVDAAGPTSGVGDGATSGDASSSGTGGDATAGTGGAPPSCPALPGAAGDFERVISVDGEDRRFLVHVPASYDGSLPTRLVIAMHGFTESPETMRDVTHFDEVADERGFVVAYPEGINGSWNGGTCCGTSMFAERDDVAFISALIDAVGAEWCVDPSRVHATGFSNGGFLSHRLGCELSDRIASIAVVSGQESLPTCNPGRAVPVLAIHGDADPVVPWDGNPFLGFPSTASTIGGWVDRDGCAAATTNTYSLGDTSCDRHTPCDGSASVELCRVSGGGHEWKGGGSEWTSAGPPAGFVATLKIADFFESTAM